MPSVYLLPCVTLLSGLISGATLSTFMIAALATVLATWHKQLTTRHAQPLFINMDPQQPDTAPILSAFRQAQQIIKRTQRPVIMRIAAVALTPKAIYLIDLNRDGDIEIKRAGMRPIALHQPGIWIPDMPLPLALPDRQCVTLQLKPSGLQRIRVSVASDKRCPRWIWLTLVMLGTLGCLTNIHMIVSATLAFMLQTYLLRHEW